MSGYYEVYKSKGQWRWRFRAMNNKIIASGESYYRKEDCLAAVDLMKSSGKSTVKELA